MSYTNIKTLHKHLDDKSERVYDLDQYMFSMREFDVTNSLNLTLNLIYNI